MNFFLSFAALLLVLGVTQQKKICTLTTSKYRVKKSTHDCLCNFTKVHCDYFRDYYGKLPPKRGKRMTMETLNNRGELLQIRSPAEFFAENQNIAGFDNVGTK
jgi:hypothetical protein